MTVNGHFVPLECIGVEVCSECIAAGLACNQPSLD